MADAARVNLSELGIWGKAVRVEVEGRYEEVWVQTVGDRTEAMERGHEAMQRKLLEFKPGGERDQALREALALLPVEDLVELVLEGERGKMQARVRREMRDPVSPRQDKEAGEGGQQFIARLSRYQEQCAELEGEREARLEELMKERRAELLGMAKEQVVELARPRRVDIECWNAFARSCDDWMLLRAVRRAEDHAQQYFQEVEEVRALHPLVKERLRAAYREVDPPEREALPKALANTPVSA